MSVRVSVRRALRETVELWRKEAQECDELTDEQRWIYSACAAELEEEVLNKFFRRGKNDPDLD